jgi:hypothetical protein
MINLHSINLLSSSRFIAYSSNIAYNIERLTLHAREVTGQSHFETCIEIHRITCRYLSGPFRELLDVRSLVRCSRKKRKEKKRNEAQFLSDSMHDAESITYPFSVFVKRAIKIEMSKEEMHNSLRASAACNARSHESCIYQLIS